MMPFSFRPSSYASLEIASLLSHSTATMIRVVTTIPIFNIDTE